MGVDLGLVLQENGLSVGFFAWFCVLLCVFGLEVGKFRGILGGLGERLGSGLGELLDLGEDESGSSQQEEDCYQRFAHA